MPEARQWTKEEIEEQFLAYAIEVVDYWDREPGQSGRGRIRGAVFSLLVALDGCSGELPAFQLIPSPHPEDKEYLQEHGENWYPPSTENEYDIAGGLHDRLGS